MEWAQVLSALWRRWYILVSGLLITAGVVVFVWQAVGPDYEAKGSVLFLPAENQVSEGQNPFLALDNLSAPASIVVARLDGEAARARVEAYAADADYLIEIDPSLRGPSVLVTVTDKTADGALDTLNLLMGDVSDSLAEVQNEVDVPQQARIRSMPLAVDSEATKITSNTVRATVAVGAVGLLLTVVATVGCDALIRRRRGAPRAGSSRDGRDGSDSTRAPSVPAPRTNDEPSELDVLFGLRKLQP